MTWSVLGVVLLAGVAACYLAVRIAESVRSWREPTTRWVRRAPLDRRRRQVPVAVERRRGPRRQEDVAREFLAGMRRRRAGSRVTPR